MKTLAIYDIAFCCALVSLLQTTEALTTVRPSMSLNSRSSLYKRNDGSGRPRRRRNFDGREKASVWSDLQRGRKEECQTAPAFSTELELSSNLAEMPVEGTAEVSGDDSLSVAIGALVGIPATCPFDQSLSCGSNKVCPVDKRPCRSSRIYWAPIAAAAATSTASPSRTPPATISEEDLYTGRMHRTPETEVLVPFSDQLPPQRDSRLGLGLVLNTLLGSLQDLLRRIIFGYGKSGTGESKFKL